MSSSRVTSTLHRAHSHGQPAPTAGQGKGRILRALPGWERPLASLHWIHGPVYLMESCPSDAPGDFAARFRRDSDGACCEELGFVRGHWLDSRKVYP